jgi:hypothetical protein
MLCADLFTLTISIHTAVDPLTLAIQPLIRAVAFCIQTLINAIASPIKTTCSAAVAGGRGAIGPVIQAPVEAVTLVVITTRDPVAALIQPLFGAIATGVPTVLGARVVPGQCRLRADQHRHQ